MHGRFVPMRLVYTAIALIVGALASAGFPLWAQTSGDPAHSVLPTTALLHVSERGAENPKITILEFADFECPYCAHTAPILRSVLRAYPDQVRLIVMHAPLSIHPNAPMLHEAALAAGEQGKFWEMYDLLYEKQGKLDIEQVTGFAKDLGLDVTHFRDAVKHERYKQIIDRDQQEALALGVYGTPTFFINGRKLSGFQSFDQWKKVIDDQLAGRSSAPTTAKPALVRSTDLHLTGAPSRGTTHAPVTIVEFADMQCPFCAKEAGVLRQMVADYPGQVEWVFKNFPLDFHPDSALAHEAVMAADAQGKFWEMQDLIFANQKAMKRADLENYARQIGLDMAKFASDLDSSRYREKIQDDADEGERIGVTGTPTLFLNGRRLSGTQQATELAKVIREELKLPAPAYQSGQLRDSERRNEIALGPDTAPVTITWYDDLGSPLTASADKVVRSLVQQYPGQVRIVFRNRPLNIYPGSELAHEAAMAAAAENKFWQMEQFLASRQSPATRAELIDYAQLAGLDKQLFVTALDSKHYSDAIDADLIDARESDVRGSPTFFVNATRIDGIPQAAQLKQIVESEISRARESGVTQGRAETGSQATENR